MGDKLKEIPLFLAPQRHVRAPLEATYQLAYTLMPEFWRSVLEGRTRWPEET